MPLTYNLSPAALPPIDLTVVLYGSARFVPALVEGIEGQTYPHDRIRLWLVDNGADDGALKTLIDRFRAWPGGLCPLPLRRNLGFTGGNNAALALQRAPYALLLNPDTRMEPGCLKALVDRALREGRPGIVEPRQIPREHPKPYDPQTGETSWCSLGCALLSREALREVGPLDDLYFMYCEDVDFSWRLRLAGYRCLYEPAAAYEHFTGDPGRPSATELRYAFRNGYALRRVYGGPARAAAFAACRWLRSWAGRSPLRDGAVIRGALREGRALAPALDARRCKLRGSSPWVSFVHPLYGPKDLP